MNEFNHYPQVIIEPSKWTATNGAISVQVEKGPNGGVILSQPNNDKTFQFAESRTSTLRSFGELFIKIAEWFDKEKEKGGFHDFQIN